MGERVGVSGARYQKVAVDIAAKIAAGEYQVGEKIYARSSLASQYAVSPETARRAIAILADLGIVEATKGSGVRIKSEKNAQRFMVQFQTEQTVAGYQREIELLLERFFRDGNALRESVSQLVGQTSFYRHSNPFVPFEMPVGAGAACVGRSLQDLYFWQNTGATVVAIRHEGKLILSPGPYADLYAGDIVYFIGGEACVSRVAKLLDYAGPAAASAEEGQSRP